MAELPLRHSSLAGGADALTELKAALDACERLLSGELRPVDGRVSFPLRIALQDREHGPWVRRFLAGDPGRPSRLDAARWRVLNTDLAPALRELARTTWPLLEDGEGPRLQLRVSDLLSGLERARSEPAPRLISLAQERTRALGMAERFLADDPDHSEAAEVHRWGLLGQAEVRGGVYARLAACERLGPTEIPLDAALERVLSDADPDGWRHFPGQRHMRRDAELGGLVLQVARAAGWTDHPLVRQTEQDLVIALDDDGLPATWLGVEPPGHAPTGTPDWPQERCPVAAAAVLLGLWHVDAGTHAERVRHGLGSLAAWVIARRRLTSPFASEAVCDARALQALRGVEPGRWREAEAVLIDRHQARQTRSGLAGTPLETALGALNLHHADALEWPDVVVRGLVDTQQADGGWPGEVLRTVVLPPTAARVGSRVLTTAACLRALAEIRVPTPG